MGVGDLLCLLIILQGKMPLVLQKLWDGTFHIVRQ